MIASTPRRLPDAEDHPGLGPSAVLVRLAAVDAPPAADPEHPRGDRARQVEDEDQAEAAGKMNATSPAIPRMNEQTAALFPDALP
jgi:hypothetical protein